MPKTKKPYHTSTGASFTAKQLLRQNRETKMDAMEIWLRENYTDPANCCPYEDGDYVYIWGGPYDASEVLSEEFYDEKYESLIEEIRENLSGECIFWSPKPDYDGGDQYDDEQFKMYEFHQEFESSLSDIVELLNTNIDKKHKQLFYRLVYSSVVSAIEVYLAEVFIALVTEYGTFRSGYVVRKRKDSKQKRPRHSEIYSKEMSDSDRIHLLTKHHWHNFKNTTKIYLKFLGISLCDYADLFQSHIYKRHDIVHRNGRSVSGLPINFKKKDVLSFIRLAKKFGLDVNKRIEARLNDPEAGKIDRSEIINDSPF